MDLTAAQEYGFKSFTPSVPGGVAVASETDHATNLPSEVVGGFSLGPSNPFFWFLILILVITGYISTGFNISVKKLGGLSAKIG